MDKAEKLFHIPALAAVVVDALAIRSDGIYVDATLGGGGHFRSIISKLGIDGVAVGLDRDHCAIQQTKQALCGSKCRVIIEEANFSMIDEVLAKHGIENVDGIFFDLGVSSHQIDTPQRGFSYLKDSSPLDMRMDQKQNLTAAKLLQQSEPEQISHILKTYGEIANPFRIARAIYQYIQRHKLETSGDLKLCLSYEFGRVPNVKLLAKIFQALRIAVNSELDNLRVALQKSYMLLKPAGRLAVISYHSLEDRIVKTFFRDKEGKCVCPEYFPECRCGRKLLLKRITQKAIRPNQSEIRQNRRCRSARLRVAEKIA